MEKCTLKEVAAEVMDKFNLVTKNPEDYLTSNVHTEQLKNNIKHMYDHLKTWKKDSKNHGLPELIIQSFGHEEIWSQLELQNEAQESGFFMNVAKVLSLKEQLAREEEKTSDLESENDLTDSEAMSEDLSDESEENLSNVDNLEIDDDDNDVEVEVDEDDEQNLNSKTEDTFFNMKEMEQFLNDQDRKEMKQTVKKSSADDSGAESDSSIDLFAESDDDKTNENIRYADFFDSAEAGSDKNSIENSDEEMEESFDKDYPSDEANAIKVDNSAKDSLENEQSSLELRQSRLKKKIGHLENSLLAERPWQLKGEISAQDRPQNSLLQEVLDFDVTAKPAIVITEQTNMKLEDIILQRVKNQAWDSVKRKAKPVKDLVEYKKKLALDQEKSKQSLAQIYENEYVKQKEAQNDVECEKPEQESAEKIKCTAAVDNLFSQLDALSHFYFTPRIVKPDVKIVSNLPAITMEEVAPVSVSEAAMLAPEEVKAKPKGDVKSKSERTETDKKRGRRQKKMAQRKRKMAQESQERDNDTLPKKKIARKSTDHLLKELTKNRNINQMTSSNSQSTKSSEKFFNQLQDQVKSHISNKQVVHKKKNAVLSAKKVRL